MKHLEHRRVCAFWVLALATSLLAISCERASAPVEDPTVFARVHQDLFGPGGVALDGDPCPEVPNGDAVCDALISARRISWFGYLAKWMRLFRLFGVAESNPGAYAQLPSTGFNLGVSHPDRGLDPLVDQGSSRSQFFSLYDVLGEPLPDFGREATSITAYRALHSTHVTAGSVKQACRISTWLSNRLATSLAGGALTSSELAAVDVLLTADHPAGRIETIRAFRPELGYLAYGRRLSAQELAALNEELGTGSTRAGGYVAFRTALSALMCSTMALVE